MQLTTLLTVSSGWVTTRLTIPAVAEPKTSYSMEDFASPELIATCLEKALGVGDDHV